MNSFTSLNADGSVTVQITNVLDYIMGDEQIVISFDTLTVEQCVELVFRYAKKCGPFLRHAGKTIATIGDSLDFKVPEFQNRLALSCNDATEIRVVQLSNAFRGGLPGNPPPFLPNSIWSSHTLFVSEDQRFLLVSLASRGSQSLFMFWEELDGPALIGLFERHKTLRTSCFGSFGSMWEILITRQEERLAKARERQRLHTTVMERVN